MKPKHKIYLRINLMSLFFIVVSFISITLAWFAYSGLSRVSTEIGVKAWYIELEKDGSKVSNDIVISLSEIYPGMDTVHEVVNIKNMGDSDATVKYSVVSARILGDEKDNYVVDEVSSTSEYVEDILSHEYPFHINANLSKNYILSKFGEASFDVSVSWPLDSDADELDSLWGAAAYAFQKDEQSKKDNDPEYQIRPSIQVVISVTAEQYVDDETSSDPRYNLGDPILFDVINDERCTEVSSTCIETRVIDFNNKIGDNVVSLLPTPNNEYITGTYTNYNSLLSSETNGWSVNTRPLLVNDILNIISTDVTNSNLIRTGISDSIVGDLTYGGRIDTEILKTVNYNGFYKFVNEKFEFLSSINCYWTSSEYDSSNAFAIRTIDIDYSKIYGEEKETSCKVIPVIIASKDSL